MPTSHIEGSLFPFCGSPEAEIQLVTSFVHMALWIWKSFDATSLPLYWRFVAEFLLFVLPQTLYYTMPRLDLVIMAVLAVVAFMAVFLKPSGADREWELLGEEVKTDDKKPGFITNFRSTIMLITVTCILAVDFGAFPRRYYKTDTFGTSLMDVGVGCIIFSAGIVISSAAPTFLSAARASAPLFVIGVVRMVMVKLAIRGGNDSEYGQYWNFFLTLGIIPYLTAFARWLVPLPYILPVGLALASLYEVILRATPLQEFLCAKESGGFIGMNKVGIFGLVGCLGLYMVSCGIADHCKRHALNKPTLFRKLLTFSMLTWALYWLLKTFFGLLASRRLMNLQFILWITSLSTTHMALLVLSDIITPQPQGHAYLLEAINQNMLAVFILANLLTGLANLILRTKAASMPVAMAVMTLYVMVLSLAAYLAKQFDITVRLK